MSDLHDDTINILRRLAHSDEIKQKLAEAGLNIDMKEVDHFLDTYEKEIFLKGCRRYTFAEYHDYIKSSVLPQFPNFGDNLIYPALGAAAEAGELADKFKKLWRDHGITKASEITHHAAMNFETYDKIEKLRDGALKEIGDVLWYLDALAYTLGSSLAECAQLNVQKLTGRAERGTSLGSGDDR